MAARYFLRGMLLGLNVGRRCSQSVVCVRGLRFTSSQCVCISHRSVCPLVEYQDYCLHHVCTFTVAIEAENCVSFAWSGPTKFNAGPLGPRTNMAAVLLYVCSAFVVWSVLWPSTICAQAYMMCPASCDCLGPLVECSEKGLVTVPPDLARWSWGTKL
jgi:hypothetical protein